MAKREVSALNDGSEFTRTNTVAAHYILLSGYGSLMYVLNKKLTREVRHVKVHAVAYYKSIEDLCKQIELC